MLTKPIVYDIVQVHRASQFIHKHNEHISLSKGDIFDRIMDMMKYVAYDSEISSVLSLGVQVTFSDEVDFIWASVTVDPAVNDDKRLDGEIRIDK